MFLIKNECQDDIVIIFELFTKNRNRLGSEIINL